MSRAFLNVTGTASAVLVGLLAAAPAGAAVSVDFENYDLGGVSSGSPHSWSNISGATFEVSDANPIAGTKSLNLLGDPGGDSRTLLDFADETGIVHAEFRVRPGVDSNSTPRVGFQLSDDAGWPGVALFFEYFSGVPQLGYHDDNTFTYVPDGYVLGNDHLVSIDVDPVADTFNLTVTDLTASQNRLTLTGNGTRTTPFANVSVLDITVFNADSDTTIDNINIATVPEPASMGLILGAGAVMVRRRSR